MLESLERLVSDFKRLTYVRLMPDVLSLMKDFLMSFEVLVSTSISMMDPKVYRYLFNAFTSETSGGYFLAVGDRYAIIDSRMCLLSAGCWLC